VTTAAARGTEDTMPDILDELLASPPLTIEQVMRLSGWTRKTLHNRIAAGRSPQPIARGARPLMFRRGEVLRALGLKCEESRADAER
jgi:predicted DNA-binding transcriptional regulator AlpA